MKHKFHLYNVCLNKMDSVCLNGWAGQGKSSRKQSQIPARIRSYIENLCLDVVTAYLFIYIYIYIRLIPSDLKKLTGVYIWNKRKDCCL